MRSEVFEEKCAHVLLCLAQIPHGLSWDSTYASMVRINYYSHISDYTTILKASLHFLWITSALFY
jgi:hypothetical protein